MPEGLHNNINQEEKSRIEKIQEKLYSRTAKIKQKDRTKLHPKKFTGTEDWEGSEDALRFGKKQKPEHLSPYAAFFFISLTFFIVAGSLAGFMFLDKRKTISPDNVGISVFGPVSLPSGGVLSLQVIIENKNSVPLEDTDLLIEFPEGTRSPAQSDKEFLRSHKVLGVIAPGEIRTETIKAIILGEEKDVKNVSIAMTYRFEGSDAKFTKDKTYAVTMSAPAFSIKTELLKEVTAGQEIMLSMDITSESPSLVSGALLQVDYPQGFVFETAAPVPSFQNNVFALGNMALGDKRRIEIKGIMNGEDGQEKVFRIYTGTAKSETSPALDTVFSSLFQALVVKKPFLGIGVVINGSADPSFVFNKRMGGDVSVLWTNNLPDKIIDGEIKISIKGAVINRNSILANDGGFYKSSDDTLLWDERTTKSLRSIPAGGKSGVSFSFLLLPLASGSNTVFRNPEIEIDIGVKGKRVSENNVPEEINSFVTKKFKVATNLQFAGRSVYYVGPFSNTGPMPPKVQNETTYTIMWAIRNTSNQVSEAAVKAVLPPYVEWKGLVSPNGTNIEYNPVSHEVTWSIGKINAEAGYGFDAPEVSFQIALTPGLAQAGKILPLISETVFTGVDDFAGVPIEKTIYSLSTMLSTDPQFDPQHANVAP